MHTYVIEAINRASTSLSTVSIVACLVLHDSMAESYRRPRVLTSEMK